MATFDKVRDIVVEQLGVEADDVTMESTFIDDLGADSLDFVELSMLLEHEFNVKFSEEDTAKVKTVGDLYRLIEKYTKKS